MDELSELFIYFAVYSLVGWVCETIYCLVLFKKLTNRGFLNGPFCPVYGFGALILLETLKDVPHNAALVFLAGTFITTALEYLTGFLLEKIFHAKWWDYSQNRFNFKGRICLLNSVLFGIMATLFIFIMYPFSESLVVVIPLMTRYAIVTMLLLYFAADLTVTVKSMHSLNLRLEALSKALAAVKDKLDASEAYNALGMAQRMDKLHELSHSDKGRMIYSSIESVRERIKQLENDNRLLQKRIIKAFPNISSTRYPEMLSMVKERVLHGKKEANVNEANANRFVENSIHK